MCFSGFREHQPPRLPGRHWAGPQRPVPQQPRGGPAARPAPRPRLPRGPQPGHTDTSGPWPPGPLHQRPCRVLIRGSRYDGPAHRGPAHPLPRLLPGAWGPWGAPPGHTDTWSDVGVPKGGGQSEAQLCPAGPFSARGRRRESVVRAPAGGPGPNTASGCHQLGPGAGRWAVTEPLELHPGLWAAHPLAAGILGHRRGSVLPPGPPAAPAERRSGDGRGSPCGPSPATCCARPQPLGPGRLQPLWVSAPLAGS